MAKHIWSIICTNSIINRDSNNVTLIEAVEEMQFGPAPTPADLGDNGYVMIPIAVQLVTLWERSNLSDEERFLSRLRIFDPSGRSLTPTETQREWNLEKQRIRTTIRLMSLPFSESGRYEFLLESKAIDGARWKRSAALPLLLMAQTEQPNDRSAPRKHV